VKEVPMKSIRWRAGIVGAVVAILAAAAFARGDEMKRQYYGPWAFYEHRGYHYRSLYYQPKPGAAYKYHYCISFQANPRYVYLFDPVSGKYWGRLDLQADGEERFSLLRAEDQKPLVRDIPEAAFPKPGKMPAIPGADHGLTVAPFPNDLPSP
jgi:hypothetical protein